MPNIILISIVIYFLISFTLYFVFFTKYMNGNEELSTDDILVRQAIIWFWPIILPFDFMLLICFIIFWYGRNIIFYVYGFIQDMFEELEEDEVLK